MLFVAFTTCLGGATIGSLGRQSPNGLAPLWMNLVFHSLNSRQCEQFLHRCGGSLFVSGE